MTREQNLNWKLQKLRELLAEGGYTALEINSQANFSWLTRGRGFIGLASVAACGSIFVTAEEAYLVTENIEAERLYVEQLDSSPEITVRPFPWNQPERRGEIVASILEGGKLATEQDISAGLFKLRTVMTPYDLSDYRRLCRESAEILEGTVKELIVGISGYELTGELSKRLWAADIEPITLMAAFDDRALQYRHPIPSADKLQNYALVVICARRNGLIASVTRNILLREDPLLMDRHAKCAMVDAVATARLKPGAVVGEIYGAMAAEYAAQ
ncbi:MAG: aminopeptidase P family protein, partial [Oscillospiraceae bacterium]|nr:aminopeptidase P family protein [Oscillospiraceae bacterium]